MAASIETKGTWRKISDADVNNVLTALNNQKTPAHKVLGFTYDPDNSLYVALVHL